MQKTKDERQTRASGDILGMCVCEFTSPAIKVKIDGSLPLGAR